MSTTTGELTTDVYIGDDNLEGFGVSSAIIYGDKEALVVDTQFALSHAYRLVAQILETGRELTQIFLTHLHPDHYLGVEALVKAFPNAKVLAYGEVADEINDAFDFKIEHWGNEVLGLNGASSKVQVERVDDKTLHVDGHPVEILGVMRGDSAHAAAIWVPETKTLVAGDIVFSDAHVWIADSRTPEMRQEWLDTLDELEKLEPAVVVPGHAPNDRPYDPDGIAFTRRYIHDFLGQITEAKDSADLMSRMEKLYPDAGVHICLEMSSKILKDKYVWDGDWPISLRHTEAVI